MKLSFLTGFLIGVGFGILIGMTIPSVRAQVPDVPYWGQAPIPLSQGSYQLQLDQQQRMFQ